MGRTVEEAFQDYADAVGDAEIDFAGTEKVLLCDVVVGDQGPSCSCVVASYYVVVAYVDVPASVAAHLDFEDDA